MRVRLTDIESTPLVVTVEASPRPRTATRSGPHETDDRSMSRSMSIKQRRPPPSARRRTRDCAARYLPTAAPPLVEFFRGMRGAIHVAFEEAHAGAVAPRFARPAGGSGHRRGSARHGAAGRQGRSDGCRSVVGTAPVRRVAGRLSQQPHRETLQELARTYADLVEDGTRVMQRLKALFRARGIRTPGSSGRLSSRAHRAECAGETVRPQGVGFRAAALYAALRRAWRTKRNLWAYAGLAVVSRSSAVTSWSTGIRCAVVGADDPRPQSQSQSGPQERVQERGHGGDSTARRAPGLLSRHASPRDARGPRARHPNAEARGAHPPPLENRSPLRSSPS